MGNYMEIHFSGGFENGEVFFPDELGDPERNQIYELLRNFEKTIREMICREAGAQNEAAFAALPQQVQEDRNRRAYRVIKSLRSYLIRDIEACGWKLRPPINNRVDDPKFQEWNKVTNQWNLVDVVVTFDQSRETDR